MEKYDALYIIITAFMPHAAGLVAAARTRFHIFIRNRGCQLYAYFLSRLHTDLRLRNVGVITTPLFQPSARRDTSIFEPAEDISATTLTSRRTDTYRARKPILSRRASRQAGEHAAHLCLTR